MGKKETADIDLALQSYTNKILVDKQNKDTYKHLIITNLIKRLRNKQIKLTDVYIKSLNQFGRLNLKAIDRMIKKSHTLNNDASYHKMDTVHFQDNLQEIVHSLKPKKFSKPNINPSESEEPIIIREEFDIKTEYANIEYFGDNLTSNTSIKYEGLYSYNFTDFDEVEHIEPVPDNAITNIPENYKNTKQLGVKTSISIDKQSTIYQFLYNYIYMFFYTDYNYTDYTFKTPIQMEDKLYVLNTNKFELDIINNNRHMFSQRNYNTFDYVLTIIDNEYTLNIELKEVNKTNTNSDNIIKKAILMPTNPKAPTYTIDDTVIKGNVLYYNIIIKYIEKYTWTIVKTINDKRTEVEHTKNIETYIPLVFIHVTDITEKNVKSTNPLNYQQTLKYINSITFTPTYKTIEIKSIKPLALITLYSNYYTWVENGFPFGGTPAINYIHQTFPAKYSYKGYNGIQDWVLKGYNSTQIPDINLYKNYKFNDDRTVRQIFKKTLLDIDNYMFNDDYKVDYYHRFRPFGKILAEANDAESDPNAQRQGLALSLNFIISITSLKMTQGEIGYTYLFFKHIVNQLYPSFNPEISEISLLENIKVYQNIYGTQVYRKNVDSSDESYIPASGGTTYLLNIDKIEFKLIKRKAKLNEPKYKINRKEENSWIPSLGTNTVEIERKINEDIFSVCTIQCSIVNSIDVYVTASKGDYDNVKGLRQFYSGREEHFFTDDYSTSIHIPIILDVFQQLTLSEQIQTYQHCIQFKFSSTVGSVRLTWSNLAMQVIFGAIAAVAMLATIIACPAMAAVYVGMGVLSKVVGTALTAILTSVDVDFAAEITGIVMKTIGAISGLFTGNTLAIIDLATITTDIINLDYQQKLEELMTDKNNIIKQYEERQKEFNKKFESFNDDNKLQKGDLIKIFNYGTESIPSLPSPKSIMAISTNIGFDYTQLYTTFDPITNFVDNALKLGNTV